MRKIDGAGVDALRLRPVPRQAAHVIFAGAGLECGCRKCQVRSSGGARDSTEGGAEGGRREGAGGKGGVREVPEGATGVGRDLLQERARGVGGLV